MSQNLFLLAKADLLNAYRTMRTIREFEERLRGVRQGRHPGFVHLYAGEEACAAGIMMHHRHRPHRLDAPRPWPLHRKGVDVREMMAVTAAGRPAPAAAKAVPCTSPTCPRV